MATRCLTTMFITSLLVLFPLILGSTKSEALDAINVNSEEVHPNNGSVGAEARRRCREARADVQCPAVCAACPPCATAPPCPRRIPPGYRYYEGLGYYRMHYDTRTWSAAALACEADGGYLAVLNSQEEANLVTSLMLKYGLTSHVHIGFTDATRKQKYLTVLGEDLASTGYAVWAPGQPDGEGTEFCGTFQINVGFHDTLCNKWFPSLCELDQ